MAFDVKKRRAVPDAYRTGVLWVALNDEPAETDPEAVAGQISVLLLADLFSAEPEAVAADVLSARAAVTEREAAAR